MRSRLNNGQTCAVYMGKGLGAPREEARGGGQRKGRGDRDVTRQVKSRRHRASRGGGAPGVRLNSPHLARNRAAVSHGRSVLPLLLGRRDLPEPRARFAPLNPAVKQPNPAILRNML